jgi:hypothetical protein
MTLTTTKADSYRKWKTLVTQQRIDRNTQFRSDNNDKKSPPSERDSTTHDARYKSIHKRAGPQQQHRTTTISASVREAHDNNNTIILHGHTHTHKHTQKNCYEHAQHARTHTNCDEHNTQSCAHTQSAMKLFNKCDEAMRTRTTL